MALSDPDKTQSTLLDSPDKIYLAQVKHFNDINAAL